MPPPHTQGKGSAHGLEQQRKGLWGKRESNEGGGKRHQPTGKHTTSMAMAWAGAWHALSVFLVCLPTVQMHNKHTTAKRRSVCFSALPCFAEFVVQSWGCAKDEDGEAYDKALALAETNLFASCVFPLPRSTNQCTGRRDERPITGKAADLPPAPRPPSLIGGTRPPADKGTHRQTIGRPWTGRRPHEGPINDELANDWCFMPALRARPYPRSHRLVDLDLWHQADWCFIAARAREGHAFASDWPFMLKHQSASSWSPWLVVCLAAGDVWFSLFVCFDFHLSFLSLCIHCPHALCVHVPPFSPPPLSSLSLSLCARARLYNADIHVFALRYVWMHAVLWCLSLLLPACVLACPIYPLPCLSSSSLFVCCAGTRLCNADIHVFAFAVRVDARCLVPVPSPPCLCACLSYLSPPLSLLLLSLCVLCRHAPLQRGHSCVNVTAAACTPLLASCGFPLSSLPVCLGVISPACLMCTRAPATRT